MSAAWILMYHHIAPDPVNVWYVTPEQLRAQIGALLERDYAIGTLEQIVKGARDGGEGADKTVAITFDDAYDNVYEYALPVLAAFGLTATVFVPTNLAGGMNTFDGLFDLGARKAERIMTWARLRELHVAGWSIQSHGCSHLPFPCLLPEQIDDEIVRSKTIIEDEIGAPVFAHAYAFGMMADGETQRRAEDTFQRAGYQIALLAGGGAVTRPLRAAFQANRVFVTDDTDQLRRDVCVEPEGRAGELG